jgi:hypothetical protein
MNLSMSVTIITFILLFILVSVPRDTFSNGALVTRSFAVSFGTCLIIFRTIVIPYFGCKQPITRNEKISFGLSMIMPFLKYHVVRLNPNFNGKLKQVYIQDWLMNIYEIVIGISGIICYQGSLTGYG